MVTTRTLCPTLRVYPLEAAKLWEISHRWWVREYYPDWVRTLLISGGRGPSSEEGNTPPGGYATSNTLSGFRLISITSIQKARIWEREEIIRGRVGESNPFRLKTCDICQGEFPYWQQDCPIAERFICDDCADDALDETGSPAIRPQAG